MMSRTLSSWMLKVSNLVVIPVVQSLSRVQLFATPRTAACQIFQSLTNSRSLLKLKSVMPSNHLVLCHPLLLPSVFPAFRVLSSESVLRIRWPKYWSFSFSFSISPSSEYSVLISFRIDWFDLPVQGTLESSPTPQFQSINSSAPRLPYGPALTSIHDYWKNHCFENNVSTFDFTQLCACVCVLSCFSCIWLFVTLWTIACQAPLSMGFSRQEYWRGLLCPPPGESSQPRDLTHVSLHLLHWQAGSLPLIPPGKSL